jgi:hypothetical protein
LLQRFQGTLTAVKGYRGSRTPGLRINISAPSRAV